MLLLSIPWAANAAGLGKLVVLSALGEPFRAEIDLLSYRDERATLTPRIASPDAYKVADFRYSPALAGSRLNIRTHTNGRNYIEVISNRPVNEPIVHLLIEVDWNSTRIVRGYTALMDPPGFGPPPPFVSAPAFVPEARPARVAAGAVRRRVPAHISTNSAAGIRGKVARRGRRDPLKDLAAASSITASLSGRIQLLENKANSSTKTLAGLVDRVASMEETIQRLQRMLEMQNSGAAPAALAPPARSPTVAKAEAVAAAEPQKPLADHNKEAPKTVALPAPPAPLQASTPAAPPTAVAPPSPPQVVAPPAPPAPAVAQAAPEEPTSTVTSPSRRVRRPANSMFNEALLVLAGGSLILLGALAYWMWIRPQRQGVTSEDILTKLLARDPKRDDVQLKLLEIYAARGDRTAYQNVAGKFHKLTGGQGEAWLNVASTGYELDPGNPLYVAGKYAAIVASVTDDAHELRH